MPASFSGPSLSCFLDIPTSGQSWTNWLTELRKSSHFILSGGYQTLVPCLQRVFHSVSLSCGLTLQQGRKWTVLPFFHCQLDLMVQRAGSTSRGRERTESCRSNGNVLATMEQWPPGLAISRPFYLITHITAKFTPLSMCSSDVWGWKKCVQLLPVQGSALFFPPASAVGFGKTLTCPGKAFPKALFTNKFNIDDSSNGPRLAGST